LADAKVRRKNRRQRGSEYERRFYGLAGRRKGEKGGKGVEKPAKGSKKGEKTWQNGKKAVTLQPLSGKTRAFDAVTTLRLKAASGGRML